MYNLLMQHATWEEGHQRLELGRLFEYTEPEIQALFGGADTPNLAELERLPVLFAREEGPVGPDDDRSARTGRITNLRLTTSRIRYVEFEVLFDRQPTSISQADILRLAPGLRIQNQGRFYETSRTHWAVKDADLFRVLMTGVSSQGREISAFRVSPTPRVDPRQLSAMMPFAGFGPVYAAIQDAARACDMACNRADDIWENQAIIQDVVDLIDRSAIVVCDCTSKNANVFYEIGVAHALGKEVILITQSAEDVPFDLRHLRYIRYFLNDPHHLTTELTNRIRSLRNR